MHANQSQHQTTKSGTSSTPSPKNTALATPTIRLNDEHAGATLVPPWLLFSLGGLEVIWGIGMNCVQVYTSVSAFFAILQGETMNTLLLHHETPIETITSAVRLAPIHSLIALVISVSIQIAVLMVSQRISAVWQRMREHAGMRGAAIEVISHLTFLQVYGLIGFVANVIGDVTFITLYTHNLVVLFLWCIFLTGSSTIVLLDGAQRLWGGFQMRVAYLRRMQQQQSSGHN